MVESKKSPLTNPGFGSGFSKTNHLPKCELKEIDLRISSREEYGWTDSAMQIKKIYKNTYIDTWI